MVKHAQLHAKYAENVGLCGDKPPIAWQCFPERYATFIMRALRLRAQGFFAHDRRRCARADPALRLACEWLCARGAPRTIGHYLGRLGWPEDTVCPAVLRVKGRPRLCLEADWYAALLRSSDGVLVARFFAAYIAPIMGTPLSIREIVHHPRFRAEADDPVAVACAAAGFSDLPLPLTGDPHAAMPVTMRAMSAPRTLAPYAVDAFPDDQDIIYHVACMAMTIAPVAIPAGSCARRARMLTAILEVRMCMLHDPPAIYGRIRTILCTRPAAEILPDALEQAVRTLQAGGRAEDALEQSMRQDPCLLCETPTAALFCSAHRHSVGRRDRRRLARLAVAIAAGEVDPTGLHATATGINVLYATLYHCHSYEGDDADVLANLCSGPVCMDMQTAVAVERVFASEGRLAIRDVCALLPDPEAALLCMPTDTSCTPWDENPHSVEQHVEAHLMDTTPDNIFTFLIAYVQLHDRGMPFTIHRDIKL